MSNLFQTILLNPIFNILVGFYTLTGSLWLSIIIFTVVIKTILIPATIPSIKMAKKQREIQPELNKIKEKYKNDQTKIAEKQMELFKRHGINPGAGCLTTILTIFLMIAVYRSVNIFTITKNVSEINERIYISSMKLPENHTVDTSFLYLDLTTPDPYLVLTIIAVGLQFLATKMIMPYSNVADKATKKTPEKTDDLMQAMQKQNLYLMPVMFFIFGLTLPSGVMLYIAISTLFQIVQTYYFSGWGGLEPWINKLNINLIKRK